MSNLYRSYRCPICKSDRCGNDANAGWDVARQASALLSEFDSQWCNDCGDVRLEEYEITDPKERAQIDSERSAIRIQSHAAQLLQACQFAHAALSDLNAARTKGYIPHAIAQLDNAIAAATAPIDLAIASDDHICRSCLRLEITCSLNPCDAVIADRAA